MAQTVLIVWEHGGNLGHLARLLPVAHALREGDCRVVFAVADERAACRYLNSTGFEWVAAPRVKAAGPYVQGPINPSEILLRSGFDRPAEAHACVQAWCELLDAQRPEAVLVDASPLAFYAARSAALHVIALGHGFEIPPAQRPGPCFSPWTPDGLERSACMDNALDDALGALSDRLPGAAGGRAPHCLAQFYTPERSALCTWPQLDHFDRGSERFSYIGPIWSEMPGSIQLPWPARGGRKVLCYLRLVDKRYDLVWQALTKHATNVLVISPGGNAKACAAARGWGITVVEQPVQLAPLLHESELVVSHGGMGIVSMALHAGKRLLLLPEHLEQGILAHRLATQGLAMATIRLRAKELVQRKIDQVILSPQPDEPVSKFALQHARFKPADAVTRIIGMLEHASLPLAM